MDAAAPWQQEIVVKPIEEIVTNTYQTPPQQQHPAPQAAGAVTDVRKQRPHKDQAINCPRCNSTNTKFCYYNNYSLSQPRYFCKGCRRYWTEGGSLRNIPVGGGSRKNKRSLICSSSNSTTTTISSSSMSSPPLSPKKNLRVLPPQPGLTGQNPNFTTTSTTTTTHDLNLGFPPAFRNSNNHNHNNNMSQFVTNLGNNQTFNVPPPPSSSSSAMELLTGISSANFMAGLQSPGFSTSGFNVNYPIQDFMRPALSFSLDGSNVIHHQEESGSESGRLLFPFESLKLPVNSGDEKIGNERNGNDNEEKENGGDNSAGFWTGMLGGGGSSGGVSWRL